MKSIFVFRPLNIKHAVRKAYAVFTTKQKRSFIMSEYMTGVKKVKTHFVVFFQELEYSKRSTSLRIANAISIFLINPNKSFAERTHA